MRINVTYTPKHYTAKLFWYKHGKVIGIAEWQAEGVDNE
jgi:hypothetical protein